MRAYDRRMTKDAARIQAELEGLGIPAEAAARMAESDASGRSPQLVREALLAGVWRNVIDPGGAWIEAYRGSYPAGEPLEALLAAGADPGLLTRLVRAMQFELAAALELLLDDRGDRTTSARWGLYEVDAEGRPARAVEDLHESLTGADPTGEADGWM